MNSIRNYKEFHEYIEILYKRQKKKEQGIDIHTFTHNCYANIIMQIKYNHKLILLDDTPLSDDFLVTFKMLTEIKEQNKKEKFTISRALKLDNYLDNVKQFWKEQPFFYDKNNIFWFWNKQEYKWEIVDEVDLMNSIDNVLDMGGQTISQRVKGCYMEAFKRYGREKVPEEAPKRWIQFKNKAFSLRSKKQYYVQSNYFFTNPIPYKMAEKSYTPVIDKLFEDWVGEEYVRTLYEIIAYCCYADYPVQVLFCLYGNGRNGKSCFLRLLSRFVGKENICSTELDLLVGNNSSRFESFKLYKKLVCLMGETNFGVLNKSSMLKKLTGGDMIGFEMKGKKPFDDINYAKMIIASNSLPTSEDTSEGFYRRWIIIDFPNEFPEGKDILETIPEKEY